MPGDRSFYHGERDREEVWLWHENERAENIFGTVIDLGVKWYVRDISTSEVAAYIDYEVAFADYNARVEKRVEIE